MFFQFYIYTILFTTGNCEKFVQGYVVKNKIFRKGDLRADNLKPIQDYHVINIYKDKIPKNDKKFSSVFVQCAMCSAIAQELHVKFFLMHHIYPPNEMVGKDVVYETLKSFCDTAFQNFDLREFRMMKTLCPASSETTHVDSYLDGLWPGKMKEMCFTFFNAYGPWYLYNLWFIQVREDPKFQMTEILCKSNGLFRYCNNINEDITPTSTTYQFSIRNTSAFYTKYLNDFETKSFT